ncbi:unnamed protein product [Brachionus calyciflorus]|uniref:Uncharacterized protein n=1 Tax=Brachionus calyciflorus TaxID=104777 RepID=A0A814BF78_9BILA|nr:unnamed protein product [Brachionus calyciflorus]
MNSQHHHKFQLDHDMRIDSDASKNIFDSFLPANGHRLKGYIQEVHSYPYAALLFAEIQQFINVERSKASTEKYSFKYPRKPKISHYSHGYNFINNENNAVQKEMKKLKLSYLKCSDFFEEEKMDFENFIDYDINPEILNSKKYENNLTKMFFEINNVNIDDFFVYKVEEILVNKRDLNNLLNIEWLTDTILEAFSKALVLNSNRKVGFISSFYSTEISYNGFLRFQHDLKLLKILIYCEQLKMSSNNENQKRRPSESSEIEENNEVKAPFRTIKAFVISETSEPDNRI